jgi:hypothetical protein
MRWWLTYKRALGRNGLGTVASYPMLYLRSLAYEWDAKLYEYVCSLWGIAGNEVAMNPAKKLTLLK